MKVLISGSRGLIGSALVSALAQAGHDVVRLVRSSPGPGDVRWDLEHGLLDAAALAGIDAAVHLAGEGIGDKRWTAAQKRRILDSRVKSTDLLSRRLAEAGGTTSVLLSGSAVGYYGDRGDEVLDEQSPSGGGFLADVCRQWEAATAPAEQAGIRVVHLRTGIVLSSRGGELKKLLPLYKFGVGGKLGSGSQYQSWVALDDEVGGILHALTTTSVSGPLNLTAPQPVTIAELTKALGTLLHRPTFATVPAFALSLALGRQMAGEMLLGGQRVLPKKLEQSGYAFRYPYIEAGLRAAIA